MADDGPLRRIVERLAGGAVAAARDEAKRARERLGDAIEAIPEGVVLPGRRGPLPAVEPPLRRDLPPLRRPLQPGARLIDVLREGVRRGDYPAAIGREEAFLAEREAMLSAGTGARHEQELADGRWLMIEGPAHVGGRRHRPAGRYHRAEASGLGAGAGARPRRGRQPRQERVPGRHEPRAAHAAERGRGPGARAAGHGLDPAQSALVADIRASAAELERLVHGLLDYGDADRRPGEAHRPYSGPQTGGAAGAGGRRQFHKPQGDRADCWPRRARRLPASPMVRPPSKPGRRAPSTWC